ALPIDQRQEQAWHYWDARAHLELLKQHALYLLTLDLQQPSPATANSKLVNEFTKIHNQFVHILRSPQAQLDVNWQHDSPTHALQTIRQQLLTLAKNRSFYGFLASEILKQPLSLNHTPITLNAKERAKLESQPGIQAAHEWFQLERYATARREWSYATRDFSPSEKTFAAKVANEWGWYNQGIFTAAFSNHKDDLVVRFPLGFFDTIYEQAIEQHLYADWTFALIRQESAYMHDARSPVGALGLMQLMPSTAKTVFRRHGEKYPGNRNILTPATNVKTGMRYLATLFKQFNGNLLLATAAYNAGPHRAISWQDETAGIPGDLWIELIPIQETRDYVKNIMTYQAIYRWHLGRAPRLSASLERVPPLSETQDE
ncbi:MAG: transglycosylase SLT domain-containing protein, partial [Gammaproteobacteria bacterium]